MSVVFDISVKNNLKKSRQLFNGAKLCYDSLKQKDSEYARSVKALMNSYESVIKIWENAEITPPNEPEVNKCDACDGKGYYLCIISNTKHRCDTCDEKGFFPCENNENPEVSDA